MAHMIEHETQTSSTDSSAELIIRVVVNDNPTSKWAAPLLDPMLHAKLHKTIDAAIHDAVTAIKKD